MACMGRRPSCAALISILAFSVLADSRTLQGTVSLHGTSDGDVSGVVETSTSSGFQASGRASASAIGEGATAEARLKAWSSQADSGVTGLGTATAVGSGTHPASATTGFSGLTVGPGKTASTHASATAVSSATGPVKASAYGAATADGAGAKVCVRGCKGGEVE
ncbi:hypothetical protein ACKKBF_B40735 [Auxenochlorella protothecoides x Auxenochlorella symbiontica]